MIASICLNVDTAAVTWVGDLNLELKMTPSSVVCGTYGTLLSLQHHQA